MLQFLALLIGDSFIVANQKASPTNILENEYKYGETEYKKNAQLA